MVRMSQFPRLHAFVRVQLEDSVERQNLNACAPVEHIARNACKDLLHDAICAVITILERLAEQETGGIHQTIIDSPGIDADTVERSCEFARFAQPGKYLVPQR